MNVSTFVAHPLVIFFLSHESVLTDFKRVNLFEIFLVVIHDLLDAIGNGNVLSNDLDSGKLVLLDIGARDDAPEILDKKLPFFREDEIDKEFAGVGMGRGSGEGQRMHVLGDEGKRRQAERSPLIFKA